MPSDQTNAAPFQAMTPERRYPAIVLYLGVMVGIPLYACCRAFTPRPGYAPPATAGMVVLTLLVPTVIVVLSVIFLLITTRFEFSADGIDRWWFGRRRIRWSEVRRLVVTDGLVQIESPAATIRVADLFLQRASVLACLRRYKPSDLGEESPA